MASHRERERIREIGSNNSRLVQNIINMKSIIREHPKLSALNQSRQAKSELSRNASKSTISSKPQSLN